VQLERYADADMLMVTLDGGRRQRSQLQLLYEQSVCGHVKIRGDRH